jgi:hypothetical protein
MTLGQAVGSRVEHGLLGAQTTLNNILVRNHRALTSGADPGLVLNHGILALNNVAIQAQAGTAFAAAVLENIDNQILNVGPPFVPVTPVGNG